MNRRWLALVAPILVLAFGCGERETRIDDSPDAEKQFQKELEENRSAEGAAYSKQKKLKKSKAEDD